MGYYTEFTLSVKKVTEPKEPITYNDLKLTLTEKTDYLWMCVNNQFQSNEIKWYEYEEDMQIISEIYSDFLFILDGVGEESSDIWRQVFYKGKTKSFKPEIIYPELGVDWSLEDLE